MSSIGYYVFRSLFTLLALLPWRVLRSLSRGIAYLLQYVVGYRRAVVFDNLRRSFPELDDDALRALASEFYHYLTFQLLSSPKLLSQSLEDIKLKHLELEGLELFDTLDLVRRKACIVMMGHCGNWELFSAGQIYFAPLGYQQEQLYRPLKNEGLDRLQRELRSRFGSLTTPKGDIGRELIGLLRESAPIPRIIAFIADQTPRQGVGCVWVNFLGQETAFLDGAERLARKYDLPVVYMDVEPLGDTHYRGTMRLITDAPKSCQSGEITRLYAQMLEQTIRRTPAQWLWSHKRWKLKP